MQMSKMNIYCFFGSLFICLTSVFYILSNYIPYADFLSNISFCLTCLFVGLIIDLILREDYSDCYFVYNKWATLFKMKIKNKESEWVGYEHIAVIKIEKRLFIGVTHFYEGLLKPETVYEISNQYKAEVIELKDDEVIEFDEEYDD